MTRGILNTPGLGSQSAQSAYSTPDDLRRSLFDARLAFSATSPNSFTTITAPTSLGKSNLKPRYPRWARKDVEVPEHPGAPWLLDLFCGAGGTSYGYWQAGFNVVGVDIEPQPHYPFKFIQMDALSFLDTYMAHPATTPLKYVVAIHASPPCQRWSKTQRLMKGEHPDYIAAVRRRVEPMGVPYVIENVVDAAPALRDPFMLCGSMFASHDLRVYRHRLFETNFDVNVPQHPKHRHPQNKMGRRPVPPEFMHVVGNFSGVPEARYAMGIPWMTRNELREAIPPAYTALVGRDMMKEV